MTIVHIYRDACEIRWMLYQSAAVQTDLARILGTVKLSEVELSLALEHWMGSTHIFYTYIHNMIQS